MTRYIGKCKCQAPIAKQVEIVKRERGRDKWGAMNYSRTYLIDGKTVQRSESGWIGVTCHACLRTVLIRGVVGNYSETTKCGPKCTGATGFQCDCQCKGKNHGGSHG